MIGVCRKWKQRRENEIKTEGERKENDLFRGKCKKGNSLKRMNLENVL